MAIVRFGALPLSLRQLQYVVAVAEARSFRRAADLCLVSQPSLSMQLAQIETALGVRLFERDRRRVLVTAAGTAVVERARRILLETADLIDTAPRLRDPLAGTLRIGLIPTISPYLLPSLTPALRKAYPALTVLWVEEKTHVLVARLASGDLDAALLSLEANLGDVAYETIAIDPFVLAVAPGHPLAAATTALKPRDLHGAHVLLLDDEHCFRDQALSFCASSKASELDFRATSLSTLAQMTAGGAGVTLLPQLAVATEVRRAALHVRPFVAPAPHRTIVLAWRPSSPLAAALRQLARTMRNAYPDVVSAPRRVSPPRVYRRRSS
jgi:LysR family transcriptional regulator, hydrogen peroxide-inducible genes activator